MSRHIWSSIFVLLFSSLAVFAQSNLTFGWTHSWGGTGTDSGNGVATDSSGNVYVAGSTASFGAGGQDVLLLKYDPSGHLLWARTWGGPSNDFADAVLVGADGSIYVVGATESYGAGWYDVLILKFDGNGNWQWTRTWGGGSFDVGYDLSFDQSGNLAISAESYSYGNSVVFLKMSTDGTLLSSTTWKGPATYNSGYSIAGDANGNTIITGTSWDYSVYPNHNTILILKFDSLGNLIWSRNWAGPSEDETSGRKVVRTDALGNIYILGHTSASCTTSNFAQCIFDTLLLKIDPNGNLLSARKWGGSGSEQPGGLWLDGNGQIEAAESTTSFFGGLQAALIQQFDGSGNVLSSKVLSTSAASGWYSLTASGTGTLVATGFAPNNGGTWQDTGIMSVNAPGTLSTPQYTLNNPVVTPGEPVGTVTDPTGLGIQDTGGGGTNVLTSEFSFGGATVIPQPPPPLVGGGSPSNNTTSGYSQEPVNTGNGNYYYEHADFTIPSRGLSLVFQRYYNSSDNFAGPLGANWNDGYNILLGQTAAGVATIRWGDGHGETYTLKNGVYVPQAGVYNTLVANPDGTFTLTKKDRTQYSFSATGRLTAIEDKNGNTTTLIYDANGNLVTITAVGGRSLTLSYDGQGRIVSATDPMGHTESYAYDGANDLVSATDPLGGVTKYTYDSAHHVTQITLPNGNTLLQNAYDSQGRVTSQTNGRGFAWQFAYNSPTSGQTTIIDARGSKTVHTYDGSLRIVGFTDALGHTTSYTYDSNNNRTSVTNQNGNTTNFSYDLNGNVTGVADPLSHSTAFTYDAENDLLTVANPNGKTTAFSYDSNGNLTGIQDALGDKTALAYDSYGELISKTDAASNRTAFSYNGTGDLTDIVDALGNTTTLAYDGDGRLVSVTDPNHHTASSVYDALGRLMKVSDPLRDATDFSYDGVGNLLSVTDANGHATTYTYDATNDLQTVTDALGHVTKYTYDQDNNRVGFTNAKGNTTKYQYDALNKLVGTIDPLAFATVYSYDPAGNVVAVTDAKGQTNRFAYDALNRLISIAYASQKSVAYHYDADGNRTSMADWTGTTSYKYDDLNRLISVSFPGNKTLAYAYDRDSRRASITYPDGKSVAYSYDADERLSAVTDWLSHITQYAYGPAGNLVTTLYPTKARIDYAYDAANRLTEVVNTTVGVPPLAFEYTLDPVGNRTVVKKAGIPTFYGYDALNQLASAQTWFFKNTWTYDAVGNRLRQISSFGTTNYSYDTADRLLRAGSRSFGYDADGNEISETDGFTHRGRTFTFDAANRLVAVREGRRISFNYDGDGNRVSESVGGNVHTYVNDIAAGLPVVLQETNPGEIASSYIYGLNLIEASQGRDNDFYQYDGLGSVIQLTDSRGRPEVSYFYDAWGNSILPAPPTNPFRFAGQALDAETALYYVRARYYNPVVGRFVSPDPLAGPGNHVSSNRYSYAMSSPIANVDPTGLASEEATNFQSFLGGASLGIGNAASTVAQVRSLACPSCTAIGLGLLGGASSLYGDFHNALRGIPPSVVPGAGDVVSASLDVTGGLAHGDTLAQAVWSATEDLLISKGVVAAGTLAAGASGGAVAITTYGAAKFGAAIGSIPAIETRVSEGEYWLLSTTFQGQQWSTSPVLTVGSDIGSWLAQ